MRLTCCLALLLSTALCARADVLPPAQDTSSAFNKLTLFNGRAATLAVTATRRSFVYFDLTTVPADVRPADIVHARLRIYFPSVLRAGELTLHTVTPAGVLWDENAVVSVPEPGLSAALVPIPKELVVAKKFVEIDVTATVQGWLADAGTNFGFGFQASGSTSVTLGAKEGPGSGYPCVLELDIERVTGAGSIGSGELADLSVTAAKLSAGAALANLGKDVTLTGTTTLAGSLTLPPTTAGGAAGVLRQGSQTLLQTFGNANFFAGWGAGNFTTTGSYNTTAGGYALYLNTSGGLNTAAGYQALRENTTGDRNTATGLNALVLNKSGNENTAIGTSALSAIVGGSGNIGVGNLGGDLLTGDNNIAIGNRGDPWDTGIIRIGTSGVHSDTYLAGVIHGDGSGLSAPAKLALPATGSDGTTGVILQAGEPLLHTFRHSFYAGSHAGNFTMTGAYGENVGIGDYALSSNTTGLLNTGVGFYSLLSNTTGVANTAAGHFALYANTTGSENTAMGQESLRNNTTGFRNSGFGVHALFMNTLGLGNVAIGPNALSSNTEGNLNTALGYGALGRATTGSENTVLGHDAGLSLTTGNDNIALGHDAGHLLTSGNFNIIIGHMGEGADDHTIRIGSDQTRAFMAGIRGTTTGSSDAIPVVIDSKGQLGIVSSSRRYKEDIVDMGDASARLLALRPVTFHYKQPYANGDKPVQFGLIAEEVAVAFPELAVFNAEGQPETVKYQDLTPLLLNEVQKLRAEKDALQKRLEKLEAAVEQLAR